MARIERVLMSDRLERGATIINSPVDLLLSRSDCISLVTYLGQRKNQRLLVHTVLKNVKHERIGREEYNVWASDFIRELADPHRRKVFKISTKWQQIIPQAVNPPQSVQDSITQLSIPVPEKAFGPISDSSKLIESTPETQYKVPINTSTGTMNNGTQYSITLTERARDLLVKLAIRKDTTVQKLLTKLVDEKVKEFYSRIEDQMLDEFTF